MQSELPAGSEHALMEEQQPTMRLIAAGNVSGGRRTLVTLLPLGRIRPNPEQPRKYFDPATLAELAASIRERGLLQPVIVRREEGGDYLLLAGERRYRASRLAGLEAIPALVRDDDPAAVALLENLQREDLTPLEAAFAISALIEEKGLTHQDVAGLIHKSRPYVSNTLALTRLPREIRDDYGADPSIPRDILISVARQKDEPAMLALWQRVKLGRLSVKEFREETAPERQNAEPSVRKAIRTARRLGRLLAELPAELPEELDGRLTRTLRRLRKRIDGTLARERRALG
jgi:ParB family transcriptional regulator, chromosome partitioning protein